LVGRGQREQAGQEQDADGDDGQGGGPSDEGLGVAAGHRFTQTAVTAGMDEPIEPCENEI
jgi:hypothetical protein